MVIHITEYHAVLNRNMTDPQVQLWKDLQGIRLSVGKQRNQITEYIVVDAYHAWCLKLSEPTLPTL